MPDNALRMANGKYAKLECREVETEGAFTGETLRNWEEVQIVDTGEPDVEELEPPAHQTEVKTASQTLKDLESDVEVEDSVIDAAEINLLQTKLKQQKAEIHRFVDLIKLIIVNRNASFPWDTINELLNKYR